MWIRKKELRHQGVVLERVNYSSEGFDAHEPPSEATKHIELPPTGVNRDEEEDISLDQLREVTVDSSEYFVDSRNYIRKKIHQRKIAETTSYHDNSSQNVNALQADSGGSVFRQQSFSNRNNFSNG